ncbi:MAG TPA: GNAT family N-acetyltransferase [Anaerolineales bacterium]|nr:GNAT family N-acetyltransferase [Anaerolineales bacterium]
MSSSAPDIEVRELTPGLLTDWLAFFDHDAFSDNPKWATCYCHFYFADHTARDWDLRSAAENREASSGLITGGRLRGYLAYRDGKPVGWCQAGRRDRIPNLQNEEVLAVDDSDRVGSIVCFIVAEPQRGRGVARRLLDAACAGFRSQGLAFAEGYPRRAATSNAANYHGPLALYLDSGFTVFRETDEVTIVRKDLTAVGVKP